MYIYMCAYAYILIYMYICDLTYLWPWRCSRTHKPLVYGRPPSLSVACPVRSLLYRPAHIYVYVSICICIYCIMYIDECVYVEVYVHICIYEYICTYVCICVCIYV